MKIQSSVKYSPEPSPAKSLEEFLFDQKCSASPASSLSDISTAASSPGIPCAAPPPGLFPPAPPMQDLGNPDSYTGSGDEVVNRLVLSLGGFLRTHPLIECSPVRGSSDCSFASQTDTMLSLEPVLPLASPTALEDNSLLSSPPGFLRQSSKDKLLQLDTLVPRGLSFETESPSILDTPPGLPMDQSSESQTARPVVTINLTEGLGIWSAGSVGHDAGTCMPCGFFWKGGCTNSTSCQFCHLCPPGEIKRRKKDKRSERRMERKSAEASSPA